jgi:dissimilatory sulfite reductase (desulfoviridin) alpha/beta subunit
VGKCPFKVSEDCDKLFKVYVGGKWGKKVRIGTALKKLFTEEEALNLIEKAILLFKKEGVAGERFGDTLDRIGLDYAEKMLTGDTLIQSKKEILG